MKNKNGVTRIQSIDELTTRRFHYEVRKLERLCEDHGIVLADFDNAEEDWICIISNSEYEIGALKHTCSNLFENYFVSNDALNLLHNLTTKYDDIPQKNIMRNSNNIINNRNNNIT